MCHGASGGVICTSSCSSCNMSSVRFDLCAPSMSNRTTLCRPRCCISALEPSCLALVGGVVSSFSWWLRRCRLRDIVSPRQSGTGHEHVLQILGDPKGSHQFPALLIVVHQSWRSRVLLHIHDLLYKRRIKKSWPALTGCVLRRCRTSTSTVLDLRPNDDVFSEVNCRCRPFVLRSAVQFELRLVKPLENFLAERVFFTNVHRVVCIASRSEELTLSQRGSLARQNEPGDPSAQLRRLQLRIACSTLVRSVSVSTVTCSTAKTLMPRELVSAVNGK